MLTGSSANAPTKSRTLAKVKRVMTSSSIGQRDVDGTRVRRRLEDERVGGKRWIGVPGKVGLEAGPGRVIAGDNTDAQRQRSGAVLDPDLPIPPGLAERVMVGGRAGDLGLADEMRRGQRAR